MKETKEGRLSTREPHGYVALVGAGPGDPGLITVKGREWIRKADVIIYDRLLNPLLLREARADAEWIDVGKKAGDHPVPQEEINRLLISGAQQGKQVVRLKGGDPFVFGRGGEELEALTAAGIEFEVVPGITSAIAVPAYAGIPLTHRKYSATATFVTGHEADGKDGAGIPWRELVKLGGTLVFLMGVGNLRQIADRLIAADCPAGTPAAVIQWGTLPRQRTVTGSLGEIAQQALAAGVTSPAVIVVGEVAGLREQLQWYERKPLFGRRILITRARGQAHELRTGLEELGAEVYECPAIAMEASGDEGALERSIEEIGTYQWLLFTSVNGVDRWFARLWERGRDARALAGVRIAVMGPATGKRLERYGVRADYCPETFVAEELAAGLLQFADLRGAKILLARAAAARAVLPDMLRRAGAEVNEAAVYRTVKGEGCADLRRLLAEGGAEMITFTSPSTVRFFAGMIHPLSLREGLRNLAVACIGPVTAAAVEEYGGTVHVKAEEYTIGGLIDAIRKYEGWR